MWLFGNSLITKVNLEQQHGNEYNWMKASYTDVYIIYVWYVYITLKLKTHTEIEFMCTYVQKIDANSKWLYHRCYVDKLCIAKWNHNKNYKHVIRLAYAKIFIIVFNHVTLQPTAHIHTINVKYNDNDNDNGIVFIAKWHTNHVQKL